MIEQIQQRMDKLKERAEWHEATADDHASMETPFGLAAAQRHREYAQRCWDEYGCLMAELETLEEWTEERTVILRGRVMR